jgi:RNA polymerase subunit RPABC4/transcription elongation factor Spt4
MPPNSSGLKCINCNADIPEDSKFCINCGKKVAESKDQFNRLKKTPIIENQEVKKYCRNCGHKVYDEAEYCMNCGVRPLAESNYCQECGSKTNPNQEICIKCGMRLKIVQSYQPPQEKILKKRNGLIAAIIFLGLFEMLQIIWFQANARYYVLPILPILFNFKLLLLIYCFVCVYKFSKLLGISKNLITLYCLLVIPLPSVANFIISITLFPFTINSFMTSLRDFLLFTSAKIYFIPVFLLLLKSKPTVRNIIGEIDALS